MQRMVVNNYCLFSFNNDYKTYYILQNNLESGDFIKLQKTLKTIQMEKDMLLKRIENDKLIRDDSSDSDVSICKTILIKTIMNMFYKKYYSILDFSVKRTK